MAIGAKTYLGRINIPDLSDFDLYETIKDGMRSHNYDTKGYDLCDVEVTREAYFWDVKFKFIHYTASESNNVFNIRIREHEVQRCMSCNNLFKGPEPNYCCSGEMCGCQGMPIEPVVCSDECFDKIYNITI